jgi:hypothetical protein
LKASGSIQCNSQAPIGTPNKPPITSGNNSFTSKPRHTHGSATNWPINAPKTDIGAATRGSTAQAQIDSATKEKAKPETPCAKPATAAPKRTIRSVESMPKLTA